MNRPSKYILIFSLAALLGCDSSQSLRDDLEDENITCLIPQAEIFQGCSGGRDCIPALSNPLFVDKDQQQYLSDTDRVLGLLSGDQALAIPHNILWWHEIVNLNRNGESLAITYCPLTGSTIAFDREPLGGVEFGVSGLLYQTNLIMYDRKNPQSLWPQMSRGAQCGDAAGTQLETAPIFEMTWGGWKDLHPNTLVISEETGHQRDYQFYPYSSYENLDNNEILFPFGALDDRRAAKERVLGVNSSTGSIVFPFLELEESGQNRVIEIEVDGKNVAIFWDNDKKAAVAFDTFVEGVIAHFTVENGLFKDTESGSTWTIDGRAIEGPLQGSVMIPLEDSYVAFWFAWAAFHDDVQIWNEN